MRPKALKYVDQEKQGNISYEHENTLKSMEFSESDDQLWLLTVYELDMKDILSWRLVMKKQRFFVVD